MNSPVKLVIIGTALCGLLSSGSARAETPEVDRNETLLVGGFWAGVANDHQHFWATDGTNESSDNLGATLGVDAGIRVWRGLSLVGLFEYTTLAGQIDRNQAGHHYLLGAGLRYQSRLASVVFGGGYSNVDAVDSSGGAALTVVGTFPLLAGFGPSVGLDYEWYRHLSFYRAEEKSFGIVTASVGIGYVF